MSILGIVIIIVLLGFACYLLDRLVSVLEHISLQIVTMYKLLLSNTDTTDFETLKKEIHLLAAHFVPHLKTFSDFAEEDYDREQHKHLSKRELYDLSKNKNLE